MSIPLDFRDPEQASRFPRHGWALNSEGRNLLWLPVLRLAHSAQSIRAKAGVEKPLTRKQLGQIRAFYTTILRFVLTQRELSKHVALASANAGMDTDDTAFNAFQDAHDLIGIFVDYSYVLVRRIADQFVRATQYSLFAATASVPDEYKKLRDLLKDKDRRKHLKPICDVDRLASAFENHSAWFDTLRKDDAEGRRVIKDKQGRPINAIRDHLEHRSVAVIVQTGRSGDGPWEIDANLGEPFADPPKPRKSSETGTGASGGENTFRRNLVATMRAITADLCDFWTESCIAAGLAPVDQQWVAPHGDAVLVTGDERHTTGMWPEI